MNDIQKLWTDYYKIGLQLWQSGQDKPEIFREIDGDIFKCIFINEYAYSFANACLDDYNKRGLV
jgi:hypothetical protein